VDSLQTKPRELVHPAAGPKFQIGDTVTMTNPQGCVFPGKGIRSVEPQEDGTTRYTLTPSDTPWFAFPESQLTLEHR
jgi:hypothetical protein